MDIGQLKEIFICFSIANAKFQENSPSTLEMNQLTLQDIQSIFNCFNVGWFTIYLLYVIHLIYISPEFISCITGIEIAKQSQTYWRSFRLFFIIISLALQTFESNKNKKNEMVECSKTSAVQGRPYQCTQCPAAFCRKPYLDIHTRIHTGRFLLERFSCSHGSAAPNLNRFLFWWLFFSYLP